MLPLTFYFYLLPVSIVKVSTFLYLTGAFFFPCLLDLDSSGLVWVSLKNSSSDVGGCLPETYSGRENFFGIRLG